MKTKLSWKKGWLKSNYGTTAEGKIVGNLKENFLKKSAAGELFGNRYHYQTNGQVQQ